MEELIGQEEQTMNLNLDSDIDIYDMTSETKNSWKSNMKQTCKNIKERVVPKSKSEEACITFDIMELDSDSTGESLNTEELGLDDSAFDSL